MTGIYIMFTGIIVMALTFGAIALIQDHQKKKSKAVSG